MIRYHGVHIVVQQSRATQLTNDVAQTACGLELVHIRRAIWIDAREQRNDFAERMHVFPTQLDSRHACNRHEVQGVVGRAAGGEQADHAVDDGFFVEQLCQRQIRMIQVDQ